MTNSFTPTQQRMLVVLSDGLPHEKRELVGCLDDELADPHGVNSHLYHLRRLLRPQGQDILCEWCNHRPRYRHVRLLNGSHP